MLQVRAASDALHVMYPVTAGLQFAVTLVHVHKHGIGSDDFGNSATSNHTFPAIRATVRMTECNVLGIGVFIQQIFWVFSRSA